MRLTVKGLRATIKAEGVLPSGRPFSVSAESLKEGEALVTLLRAGATVPGGSNAAVKALRGESAQTDRAYVGAVCASLLRAGVAVPGEGLKARREALKALSAPSVLVPGHLFPGKGGDNDTARVAMSVYRDGLALWGRVWEETGEAPGYVRAIREGDDWRVFLSAT